MLNCIGFMHRPTFTLKGKFIITYIWSQSQNVNIFEVIRWNSFCVKMKTEMSPKRRKISLQEHSVTNQKVPFACIISICQVCEKFSKSRPCSWKTELWKCVLNYYIWHLLALLLQPQPPRKHDRCQLFVFWHNGRRLLGKPRKRWDTNVEID
jgi:hypothetical protein